MKFLLIALVIPAVLLGRASSKATSPGPVTGPRTNASSAAVVAVPPQQLGFPRLPEVKTVMNSSTATFGRISNDVSQIHSHVEQLEAANAGKLADRKARNEALLKAQVSQNRVLQAQNEGLALEIAALRKGNQDLRSKALNLENGNEALRKEMIAVNAKVLEASGFIQTTLNLTNDAEAVDLAVLRGKDEVASHHAKRHHRHHHGEEEEEEEEEKEDTVGTDSGAAEDVDAKETDDKEEVDDSSDAGASSVVAIKDEATDKASAKDEEDQKDDDDNSASDKEDDEDEVSGVVPKSGSTSKIQIATGHKTSGFLRALHRGKASVGTALVELKARTHRYHRRFRQERDTDGSDEEAEDEDSHDDDSTDGEDDTPTKEAKEVVTETVDEASEKMLTDLKNEIERLHAQNVDSVAKMDAEFVKKHKSEDAQMRQIIAQQKALNASKASFVETQHQLNVAVRHLEGTRDKVEAQMKNLGGFLRNLGHFLTAPAKEDPSKLIKAMPALISE